MLKKWVILLLATIFVLSACHPPVYNQTEGNVADVVVKTTNARHKFDATGKPLPPLVVKQGLYVDTTPISLERQPQWLRNHIVIRGDQLPFSYYSRTIASGAGSNILTKYQAGLDPSTNVTMSYSGTVKGALDILAAKAGYVYSVHSNSVYWQAFISKTFDIAFMPGGTDYLMGKASSGGGSSGSSQGSAAAAGGTVSNYTSSDSSDSEYSSLKGTLSIWKDLDTTIKLLLTPQGKVVVSESTSSVTVNDRPTNVELVGKYISNLNNNLSKQVLVKVQILEIALASDFEFGIDWQLIANAFTNSKFIINGDYGTPVTIKALSPQVATTLTKPFPSPHVGLGGKDDKASSYTLLLNALSQQGKASVVSEPRVLCLNNSVSVIRIVRQEGYAASVQNTSLAGSSSGGSTTVGTVTSQITPGTVITGLTLYILPKILKDKIYLQVNADLSTNEGIDEFTSGGDKGTTGSATIELPKISEKHFNQRSMIRSGDTLILSGFRQVGNTANANQFMGSQALGGIGSTQLNRETIVLITPIILNGTA